MAQLTLNNPDNINVPSNVSVWFDKDWAGTWLELGDCIVDGVDLAPEFAEHRSYRNGVNALRKRILTAKAASVSLTLSEPNLLNLHRAVYGGAIETSGFTKPTIREGRMMQAIDAGGSDFYFDIAAEDSNAYDEGLVLADFEFYAAADYQEATDLAESGDSYDSQGRYFVESASVTNETDWFYVKYSWQPTAAVHRTELFGVSVVEGACQIQARNVAGGADQYWYFNSVNLAPNGAIPTPLDAVQTVPLTLTLQERGGSFGYVYAEAT